MEKSNALTKPGKGLFNPPLTPGECERGKLSVGKVISRRNKTTEYKCEDFENIPEGEWWLTVANFCCTLI